VKPITDTELAQFRRFIFERIGKVTQVLSMQEIGEMGQAASSATINAFKMHS
jgi:hypothetical protein